MIVLMVMAMVVVMVVVMRVAMEAGRGVGHRLMLYYNARAEQATPPGGGFSPCWREIAPGNRLGKSPMDSPGRFCYLADLRVRRSVCAR